MRTTAFKSGQQACQTLLKQHGKKATKLFYNSTKHDKVRYEPYLYFDGHWYIDDVQNYWEGFEQTLRYHPNQSNNS